MPHAVKVGKTRTRAARYCKGFHEVTAASLPDMSIQGKHSADKECNVASDLRHLLEQPSKRCQGAKHG